jgi:hypothetical protein
MLYLLVTSSAYRQSSAHGAAKAKADPANTLLWRQNRRRLDAEALRDSVLHAAGTLNTAVGGPSVRVPLEPEVYDTIFTEGEPDNLWPILPDKSLLTRRSLYLLRKRNVRLPMLAVFDQPDMMSSCAARGQSVHALQALTLMNSDFMAEQSRALAKRLFQEHPTDGAKRLERLRALTVCRPFSAKELETTRRFLADQTRLLRDRAARGKAVAAVLEGLPAGTDAAEFAAWTDLCLATLNLNDFVGLR